MNKTVLITGCSSGLGKASARYYSGKCWNVIATMSNPEMGSDLSTLDGALVTRLDVKEPGLIEAAVETGVARFGRIDALVNNAGFGLFGIFEATSREFIPDLGSSGSRGQ
jgi:NAD(P)-dependent dehydrogenase (short-subunit alcohol dehydrogenase family)